MKRLFSKKFMIAALLLLTALIYINTLQNGFVYDDHGVVEENIWITDVKYLPKLLSSSIWGYDSNDIKSSEYFRPMTQIAYMIEHHIFGLKPWGWHLVNILLHMLNALMVFLVGHALFLSFASGSGLKEGLSGGGGEVEARALTGGFLSALLFSAHPVNVESVAWVACIGELMYMFFAMTAFYVYISLYPAKNSVAGEEGGRRVSLYLLSLLLYLLAALSKETGLTLPALLIAYDYMRVRRVRSLPFRNYLAFLLVAAGYLLLRSYALKGVSPREAYLEHPLLQALNFFPVMLKFIGKLVLPLNLTPAYIYEPILSVADPLMLVSIVTVAGLAYLLWRYSFTKPWLPMAAMIFFAPLTPTFLLLFRDHVIYHISIPSERFLYMPSAGAALIVGFFVVRRFKGWGKSSGGSAWMVALIALLFIFSYGTVKRNAVWKSDFTLWEETLRVDPDNYFTHFVMAEILMNDGRPEEALRELNEVERLRPGYPAVNHRRGMVYFAVGEDKLAEAEFEEVLRKDPASSDAHYNLATLYLGRGAFKASLEASAKALETVTSGYMTVKILNCMAVAYTALGEYDSALIAAKGALKVDPSNEKALENMSELKRIIN